MEKSCIDDRCHIFSVLKKVLQALERKDYVKIKKLSDQVIHSASIEQDPDVVSVAVIIYSLSKLVERESYKDYKSWPEFYKNYIGGIKDIIKALEKNNIEEFRRRVDLIIGDINKVSGNLKIFISDVFRRARINKASRIYEHGISMETTAKILGISVWELAEYAGKTRVGDVNWAVTMPIRQRIKFAEGLFR